MDILTDQAIAFLQALHSQFDNERRQLLDCRISQYKILPTFLEETRRIREDPSWKCAPLAPGMIDRRVEITGPASPSKMVINALNSNATQYMADFEDSLSPTWKNILDGHQNVTDAIHRTIRYESAEKTYELRKDVLPTLIVRPRGWHMDESNVMVHGVPMSASLFDVGLYMYHNAKKSIEIGQGPYFYLPKMESYLEARLWASVFTFMENALQLPKYCIRATCLIETFPAVFQMEEILYELRHYTSGLNSGRWDYIFSFIKKFRTFPKYVLPDREHLVMSVPFLSAYSELLVQTCHKRNVHAIGGMSAFVPVRGNQVANQKAAEKVYADKLREVNAGFDGTWALHPDFVTVAREVFDKHMSTPNQLHRPLSSNVITPAHLLTQEGLPINITNNGIKQNVKACILYLHAWLAGTGSVAVDGLMEDLATMEISRTQLWQWLYHGIITPNQYRICIIDICEEYKIPLDSLSVQYLERLLNLNEFHDFTSTAVLSWKSKL